MRKAVSVAACSRPSGVPVGERRVMAPVGRMVGLGAAVGLGVVVVVAVAEVRVMTVGWPVSDVLWGGKGGKGGYP